MKQISFMRTSIDIPPEENGGTEDDACGVCGTIMRHSTEHGAGSFHNPLSLDRLLVTHPHATFFVQAGGDTGMCAEMVSDAEAYAEIPENMQLGVRAGDILTIDRSVAPSVGRLVLASHNGELSVCRLTEHEGVRFLVCGQEGGKAVALDDEAGACIWGVVVAVSRQL